MNCKIKDINHTKVKDTRYIEHFVTCPLIEKDICIWCCLHISDLANPRTREIADAAQTEYSDLITNEQLSKFVDWDGVWTNCFKCINIT